MIIPTAADPLRPCGTDPAAFDALICSSGAELCYPWMELSADEEYRVLRARVAPVARGAREVVRAAVPRLGKAKAKKVDSIDPAVTAVQRIRCKLVYTRACTRLNVIPPVPSASRPRALRYLSIQRGTYLSKVAVQPCSSARRATRTASCCSPSCTTRWYFRA
nr:probable sucrose-phosphate synthase 5 isoform X2 [Setaria viridis]